MAGIHGHYFDRGLTLILHTPGGSLEAAQTIVEYLRSKFSYIEAIVPTYAMSAGTMIALGCNQIVMGRQSQLGPTDPQLIVGDRAYSAHAIIDQFNEAKREIAKDTNLAHAWAPVLQRYGPALLQEARRSVQYGTELVAEWLQKFMLANEHNAEELALIVAKFFSGNTHGSHGESNQPRDGAQAKCRRCRFGVIPRIARRSFDAIPFDDDCI